MIAEINKTRLPRLAIYALLLFSIVPTGTTVLYFMNRQLFFSTDYVRFFVVSAIYVMPIVFVYVILGMMIYFKTEKIDKLTGKVLNGPTEEALQSGEHPMNAAICASIIVANVAILIAVFANWFRSNYSFSGYVIGNGVPMAVMLIIAAAVANGDSDDDDEKKMMISAKVVDVDESADLPKASSDNEKKRV